jgi:hypothetical protein
MPLRHNPRERSAGRMCQPHHRVLEISEHDRQLTTGAATSHAGRYNQVSQTLSQKCPLALKPRQGFLSTIPMTRPRGPGMDVTVALAYPTVVMQRNKKKVKSSCGTLLNGNTQKVPVYYPFPRTFPLSWARSATRYLARRTIIPQRIGGDRGKSSAAANQAGTHSNMPMHYIDAADDDGF